MTTSSSHSDMTGRPLKPGDKLDKYTIAEQVGAGAASVIYKGHDPLLDRYVAIKQLTFDGDNADEAEIEAVHERFISEAKLQKSIDDKHLVKVYDLLDEERGLFIVMEFIDGLSLEQVLAQTDQPIDYRRVLGIVGACAMALQTIHDSGIVHRDLKPSNIMLPHDGGLKVCDFGVAALLDEQDVMTVGSARYMAPELFADDPVDRRADIYALGMIAYELLVGRRGFNEAFKLVLRDQRNQALRWMKWHTNARTRITGAHDINPDVPKALSDLVARMMEKDPHQRIDSGDDLIAVIRRHFSAKHKHDTQQPTGGGQSKLITPTPGSAPGPGAVDLTAATATLPTGRRPLVIAAGVVVILLLLTAVAAGGWWAITSHQQSQRIAMRVEQGRAQYEDAIAYFTDGNYVEAHSRLQAVRNDWPDDTAIGRAAKAYVLYCEAVFGRDAGDYDQALELLKQVEQLEVMSNRDRITQLADDIRHRAAFEQILSQIKTYLKNGNHDTARSMIRQQQERRVAILPRQKQQLDELAKQLEVQLAESQVQQALATAKQLAGEGKASHALAVLNDARLRQPDSRIDMLIETIKLTRSYEQLIELARKADKRGDAVEAIGHYVKALEIKSQEAPVKRLRELRGEVAYKKGRKLLAGGQTAAARQAFTQALSYGDNPPAREQLAKLATADQVTLFIRSGRTALLQRDYAAAVKQYESAIKLGDTGAAPAGLKAAKVGLYLKQANQYLRDRKLDKARAVYQAALQLDPTHAGAREGLDSLELRTKYMALLNEGDKAKQTGDLRTAKRYYARAQGVLSTDEIQKRLDDTEYASLIALAKTYIARLEWHGANATLKTAQKIRDSEQVQQLLTKVSKHVRK